MPKGIYKRIAGQRKPPSKETKEKILGGSRKEGLTTMAEWRS